MSNRSRGSGGGGGGGGSSGGGGDADHRATPPNIDVMYSLKVDNLTYRTRVEDLRRYFDKFGPIGDIYIPRDQFSRSSRGYAFIRYVISSFLSRWNYSCGFFFFFLVTRRNVMPKMHSIVWMELISMDETFVFNLLAMVVPQRRTVVINQAVIVGRK